MYNRNFYIVIVLLITASCWCCEAGFLDVKPRSNLVVPTTLKDFRQLLDNYGVTMGTTSEISEVMADDYYWNEAHWNSRNPITRNAYVWAADLFGTEESHSSWSEPYTAIFYANVVLDGLEGMDTKTRNDNELEYNHKRISIFHTGFFAV
ncbi:RagB/SusD family nutrient uptake outer membrane protein [Parapedobacter sp. 10938]|uniref:RagB/SusD family nutrient uptake outer membrane protein n=1 Tax=Parapedobacter flavus TaxID=3110225 RepID=UPI002DBB44AE|nr:RagB/SusD family nutrient uptake outer membrane protein [Parapedobacter sp. 10938]MEC3879327.1 RagB/SusD family nutrient uptake outer membrane protein [Parapedobacter sp. 10938]